MHYLRQKTVTQSAKGLAKIAEGASPRRHAETSPVKVKDTHLMNNKQIDYHYRPQSLFEHIEPLGLPVLCEVIV